jgi:hypothetical protein
MPDDLAVGRVKKGTLNPPQVLLLNNNSARILLDAELETAQGWESQISYVGGS